MEQQQNNEPQPIETTSAAIAANPMLYEGTVTRQSLSNLIESKEKMITILETEIEDLHLQSILLSDEKQWFVEQVETHPKRKWERKTHYLDGKLVGRRHWTEEFKDEDTGQVITIERSQVVRVDGVWQ